MICVNCHSIIVDLDDTYFSPEDMWREDPMCAECAPPAWMPEFDLDYLDKVIEDWEEEE